MFGEVAPPDIEMTFVGTGLDIKHSMPEETGYSVEHTFVGTACLIELQCGPEYVQRDKILVFINGTMVRRNEEWILDKNFIHIEGLAFGTHHVKVLTPDAIKSKRHEPQMLINDPYDFKSMIVDL